MAKKGDTKCPNNRAWTLPTSYLGDGSKNIPSEMEVVGPAYNCLYCLNGSHCISGTYALKLFGNSCFRVISGPWNIL